MSTEDRALVHRCVAGGKGAWDEFVRRTRSAIYRGATVALRKFRVSDKESIDNVYQQANPFWRQDQSLDLSLTD